MKDFWKDSQEKKVNKNKIIIIIVILIIILASFAIVITYQKNRSFQDWMDKNIFRKEIRQEKLATIELKDGENSKVYAFNQSITVLSKNNFTLYNNTGKEEKTLKIEITTPLFNSAGHYLAIGETKGQKLYLIEDKDIAWEKEVEGNIAQVHVNKNGYVAVCIVDTSYKTVISVYDPQGKPLFRNNLSSTRVTDVSISNDNKYLAIAEIDTSGTRIQSNIKIISMEKAETEPKNSIVNTYQGENNDLLVNLQYQDKNRLIAMYADKINVIYSNGEIQTISNNDNKKITFSSIELTNHIVTIEEKSSGLFKADSVLTITNTENKSTSLYTADSVTKEFYTYENVIALNLGTEVEFINTSGWLMKRYIAEQEITNITVTNSLAGIIYRDRIEIINL